MKLKLNNSLKSRLFRLATQILADALDGVIEFPEQVATSLEELAQEIRQQNPPKSNK